MKKIIILNLLAILILSSFIPNTGNIEISTKNPKNIKKEKALKYVYEAKRYSETGKIKKAQKYFKKAFAIASGEQFVFEEYLSFLISNEKYKEADIVLSTVPIDRLGNSSKAILYYFRALTNLKQGWGKFKNAQFILAKAKDLVLKSKRPNLKFLARIENALGYTDIMGRGFNKVGDDGHSFTIIHPRDLKKAIPHFVNACVFDPEFEAPRINLDTVLMKLAQNDLTIPEVKIDIPENATDEEIKMDINISTDSTEEKEVVYDVNLLPNNYQKILNHLKKYDEIVLALDFSGSMEDPVPWGDQNPKINILKNLTKYLAKELPKKTSLGVMSIENDCYETPLMAYQANNDSRIGLINAMDILSPFGETPLNRRLQLVDQLFTKKKNKKCLFLISDGMDSCEDGLNLCGTAAALYEKNIDLSVFSFILEGMEEDAELAYGVYECMTKSSQGKVFKVNKEGNIVEVMFKNMEEELIMVLPPMKKSTAWRNTPVLFESEIEPLTQK